MPVPKNWLRPLRHRHLRSEASSTVMASSIVMASPTVIPSAARNLCFDNRRSDSSADLGNDIEEPPTPESITDCQLRYLLERVYTIRSPIPHPIMRTPLFSWRNQRFPGQGQGARLWVPMSLRLRPAAAHDRLRSPRPPIPPACACREQRLLCRPALCHLLHHCVCQRRGDRPVSAVSGHLRSGRAWGRPDGHR